MRYFRRETVSFSLTSPRMNESKQSIHLIASGAIFSKFIEMADEKKEMRY